MSFFHKRDATMRCQLCGEVSGAILEQHHSIYVKGDWEGFTERYRSQLDPTATYLVNPFHDRDGGAVRIQPPSPERIAEMCGARQMGSGATIRALVIILGPLGLFVAVLGMLNPIIPPVVVAIGAMLFWYDMGRRALGL